MAAKLTMVDPKKGKAREKINEVVPTFTSGIKNGNLNLSSVPQIVLLIKKKIDIVFSRLHKF